MTHKNLGIALVCLLLLAVVALAADAPVGDWSCTSTAPGGGEINWTLSLKEVDGKLVGTAAGDEGQIAIDDAKFEDDTLTFSVSLDSGTYDITLKPHGDKIEGSWKGGGETGAIKGTKKA